jgi:hypothetical protein
MFVEALKPWPCDCLIARFVAFFAILYFSMLSAVLSNYRRWKHFFFSLISFCTSSVHHHVSLILRGHLVNTSRHLDSHIVRITLFFPRALLNDPLLERLSYLPFELPPFCSSNFGAPRFRYGVSLRGLSPNEIISGFISVAYLEKNIRTWALSLTWAQCVK